MTHFHPLIQCVSGVLFTYTEWFVCVIGSVRVCVYPSKFIIKGWLNPTYSVHSLKEGEITITVSKASVLQVHTHTHTTHIRTCSRKRLFPICCIFGSSKLSCLQALWLMAHLVCAPYTFPHSLFWEYVKRFFAWRTHGWHLRASEQTRYR